MSTRPSLKQTAVLLLLTAASILVHGYHPYVEDAEIYVPGIKKALNPNLYPYNAEFFSSHARLTLFPNLIAASVRLIHVPLDWALFLWHFLSVFLLLLACWHLGRLCFRDPRARWGAPALVASLLTIPVAGTALYITDQYLNPRSLSTPAALFIAINTIERKFVRVALWGAFAAVIHPLMAVFGICFALLLLWMEPGQSKPRQEPAPAAMLPFGLFPPVTDAYREVLESHPYFFLRRWEWYEWLGIFAPVALLWCFARIARRHNLAILDRICRTVLVFELVFFVLSVVVTMPAGMENFAELQPMRSLHLVYVVFFAIAGGLLAQFALKDRAWRWLALFVPLCGGMWFAQRQLFPASPHIEWPGAASPNDWVKAFRWIRQHTPPDAYFALNPDHMEFTGEDHQGFRAIAERSMLADRIKDSGAVTMFPALAETWGRQVLAQRGWKNFQAGDFRRLKEEYGVNWVVWEESPVAGLDCPYPGSDQGKTLSVCRIE